ncbi:DMT family transporter [Alphaproteobacteria bacterium]|nr:DMT family transporter [Alphaproteobacteria bacterium]
MKEKLYNPHLFLTLASLFWGFNAIAGRLAVDEISPMLLVTGRWLGVMIILSIICRNQLSLGFQIFKSNYKWMILMGLSGFTIFNSIYYISARYTVAINLGIVQSTMPAFIMIISMFWLKTSINLKQVTGLLVTFIGVSVVISNGNLLSLLTLKLNNGDLLLVIACIFYAIYAVGLRKRPKINDILLMTIFSYVAFLGSLPGLVIEITQYSFFFPTFKGLIILSVIIIFPSLLAQILFMKGVKIVGPSLSGLYTNLVPLFTSLLAIIVLDENFHIYHLISLMIIFLGIYIFDRKKI